MVADIQWCDFDWENDIWWWSLCGALDPTERGDRIQPAASYSGNKFHVSYIIHRVSELSLPSDAVVQVTLVSRKKVHHVLREKVGRLVVQRGKSSGGIGLARWVRDKYTDKDAERGRNRACRDKESSGPRASVVRALKVAIDQVQSCLLTQEAHY